MPYDITNFPNSFIQFTSPAIEDESCNDFSGVVLPIHFVGDIAFCFVATAASYEEAGKLQVAITRQCVDPGDDFNPAGEDVLYAELAFTVVEYESGKYLYICYNDTCVQDPLSDHGAVDGECLYLLAYRTDTLKSVLCSTQRFVYAEELCFTRVVKYWCADDAFGFPYELLMETTSDTYYNAIRLPLDITSPRPLTKKTGFELSDGEFLTLSATKKKEWNVESDYLTDHIHQCLDAAIDHDNLFLFTNTPADCAYAPFEFYHDQEDKYDIDWQEGPGLHLGVAKAKFKLKANPYYSQNSNC